MKLKEFKHIINSIPNMFDNVDITIINQGKAYIINDSTNIEWYTDAMDNNKLFVDITTD